MWGQLAVKALVSGVVIALAAELARRNPGWGGLVASLPLTTLIALVWLWRDTHDPLRAADFVTGTALYVIAALPALGLIALLLRRGSGFTLALLAGALTAMAGYLILMWLGRRFALPV
jgi:F0F1-type ATP synthase assembly protein I